MVLPGLFSEGGEQVARAQFDSRHTAGKAHLAPATAGKYLEVWQHMLNVDAEEARQKDLAASDP